jgi:type I restriction enzyme, S subunit
MLCDKAYRLRAKGSTVLPDYLVLVLNSPRTLREIEGLKTGINDSGVNLTQDAFLSLKIPVPTLAEQAEALKRLAAVVSNLDEMDFQATTGLAKISALRQAILKRAFSGRLVQQDPSDEPAVALLARLGTEPDVAPARRKTPRKQSS